MSHRGHTPAARGTIATKGEENKDYHFPFPFLLQIGASNEEGMEHLTKGTNVVNWRSRVETKCQFLLS